ncbi:MAG TPA: hypothetical protein VN642_10235 [Dongiaceae bacterium]|nr:hypothetical protein [Dongiaceae bacterium]
MAIVTDGTAEKASVSTGTNSNEDMNVPVLPEPAADREDSDGPDIKVTADLADPGHENIPNRGEVDRSEEIPSLLDMKAVIDNAPPDPDHSAADEDTIPADGVIAAAATEASAPAVTSLHDQPDERPMPAIIAGRPNTGTEAPASGEELKSILEALQDSVANTQYISSKIDAVSDDTAGLIKQVNGISLNCELLTAEMESISSGANATGMLSKTFLTISSLVLAVLVIIQIYMFFSLYKIQRLQNSAGSSVLERIDTLSKKIADYDKNLTKSLENPVKQELIQTNAAATEKANLATHENINAGFTHTETVHERLNKLRNGLPEKQLIRKETGDWFVYNKKSNECIADVEVIQALNDAYRKIGRSMSTTVPLPPINALCILKPDGKGGTQIVMTEKFVP